MSATETVDKRARRRLVAYALPLLVALGPLFGLGDVAAQPAAQSTKADAGAPGAAKDGGTSTGDAGATALAASADAGATLATGDAGAAASASATASTPAPATLATAKKVSSPPPPPPTPDQIAALAAMKQQVEAYESGAKEYRDTVTTIIKIHYETKKKAILSGLDQDIVVEKEELKKARETAIKRLEEFIATYSGPRAHPEATPDAMYRLAALYEERARSEEATEPVETALKPAIALYKRAIREFPAYRERAGLLYFLGHALIDTGRTDEGQQVWRGLVCHNKYPYPVAADPKDPEKDLVKPMVQDHDEAYWTAWRHRYPTDKQLKKGAADTQFQDPFGTSCTPMPQPGLKAGEDPKYVAEIWWQIGNWEFDLLDAPAGLVRDEAGSVYGYNRAASAYKLAMQLKKPPLYGVSLYKYAWTLFKQQRYEAATREFVHLLNYTDEQQKLTGDPGADFRAEAYTYIAGSLTNVDFEGPGENDPYILRPDIVDTEPRPDVAEKKLHVAIDRVKDPQIVPQDKTWTIEVYKSLAFEYRSLNQFGNAIEVYELILQKWPMDPSAPEVQNSIAETYDQMNLQRRPGTPEYDATAAKALEARTKLANYIGNTPWTDANKDNPTALQNAERLVRGGLRQAAAAHTNNGRAALVAANETGDPARQVELLARAEAEYKLAATGWYGYLTQDENAPDAYESRYWLADARRQGVRIRVILRKLARDKFPEPARKDIDEAIQSAVDVRDSNEDDRFLDNSAFFVVDLSDVDRDLAYTRHDEGGRDGVEKREEVKFAGEGDDKKVQRDEVPPVVLRSVQARDEYVARVPPSLDVQKNGLSYNYYSAEVFFLYGQFDQARARFEPMWKEHCAKNEFGYKAWEKLITMSNLERDVKRSTELAEAEKAKSCAVSAEQTAKAGLIVNPTLQEAAFVNARRKFEEAKNAPPGPARDKLWREAAALYEAALEAAPGRDEAPEAAMNAAYAYKQVGEFNRAIGLYEKFIGAYGSEERLAALEKGDPKAKTGPQPKKYQERLQYLNDAYDALATTYYGFFNYQRAAETYEKIGANGRFTEQKRREAAKNAMVLYMSMGQRDKMTKQYRAMLALKPTPDDKASADWLIASYDYKQWSPTGPDTGENKQHRFDAIASLTTYYAANRNTQGAAKYLVEAAWATGKMQKPYNDVRWKQSFKNTIAAWQGYDARAPKKDGKSEANQPPYSDYVAEADFTLVDEDIKAAYETNRHKYEGAVIDIIGDGKGKKGKYQANAEEADKWDKELDRVVRTYQSVEWVTAATARRGTLFDTLRTGLYNLVPPALKYFSPQQEKTLKTMEDSGRSNLEEQAMELRDRIKEDWRSKKEKELAGSDALMVRHYAGSIALAQKYNVRNPQVTKAIGRLAYFTDIIGEAKMREHVTSTADPANPPNKLDYKDGMYVQRRPGLTALPPASGASTPLPIAP